MGLPSDTDFISRKTFAISLIVLAVVEALAFYFVNKTFSPSDAIVFVRSDYLVENYQGTKEARIRFNDQKQTLQANLDTLNNNFQSSLSRFNAQADRLTRKDKIEWESKLSIQEQQLNEYAQAIESQIQQEDAKLVKSILNQINSFAAQHAKKMVIN